MNEKQVGEILDQLPISKWHWKSFFLIGFGLQVNGFLNSSGSTIMADLTDRGMSNNYYNAYFSSAMMVGFFIGSLIGGVLGDRIGRKKAYLLSLLTFSIFSLLASFSPNIIILIFYRAMMGIGMGSGIVIGYASFSEFTPAKVRGKWSARLSLLGNLSPLIATTVSYLVIPRFSWRMVFFIGSLASFLMTFLVSKYLMESPRWYSQQGRYQESAGIIEKVIKEIDTLKNIKPTSSENKSQRNTQNIFINLTLYSFFKGELGRRTLVSSAVLIAMNVSLYSITVWIPTLFVQSGINISKSLFMNMIMMIGAPLGVYASTHIIDKLPRKKLGPILILSIAILGYLYSIQTEEWRIMLIGGILIFVLYIYNSFSSAVYAAELWPTEIRMRGVGISNAIGRIVAIFLPYLIAWLIEDYSTKTVFLIIGIILSICAVIILLFGIETRGKSIEEITKNDLIISNNESDLVISEIKT